jgi:hypothetical protein
LRCHATGFWQAGRVVLSHNEKQELEKMAV